MIHGNIGFRFQTEIIRTDAKVIETLAKYPTPNIADAMGRFRMMDPGMTPINQGDFVAGPAVTVMVRPGDNLMLHKALELAQPGDVLVVNTFGSTNTAVWGGLMTRSAQAVGIAGIIVDGAVRDGDDMGELGFPAFSRSLVGSGCDKEGPGEVNFPICCGGVVVNPGDVIVASRDGIVVVPRDDVAYVAEQVVLVEKREATRVQEIVDGKVFKDDINNILRAKKIIE